MTHGPTRIKSKEECIYCGAKDVVLTDEHILPFFIGGNHIIKDASCRPCARVTSKFERDIAKGLWGDARTAYNSPSRRKNKRKKDILLDDQMYPGNKFKIPYKEYPAPMVFYCMDTAGFLLGLPEAVDRSNTWTFKAIVDQKILDAFNAKYPGQLTATMKFNHDSYARLLEKIAYGQILCSLDPGEFRPICLPYILGEKTNHSFIVGSRKDIPEPQAGLGYSMGTICFGTSDYLLLIVELRIIADNHTPVYHILVGDVSGRGNVEHVRSKIVATYEVTLPDNTQVTLPDSMQDSPKIANVYHWMPRVWPLENVMRLEYGK